MRGARIRRRRAGKPDVSHGGGQGARFPVRPVIQFRSVAFQKCARRGRRDCSEESQAGGYGFFPDRVSCFHIPEHIFVSADKENQQEQNQNQPGEPRQLCNLHGLVVHETPPQLYFPFSRGYFRGSGPFFQGFLLDFRGKRGIFQEKTAENRSSAAQRGI